MKHARTICIFGISLTLASFGAISRESDCGVARDPRRCEAQQAAREACNGLQGQAHSACIQEAMPPPDCSHAPNTAQCESRLSAAQSCKDKRGKARRKCVRDKTQGN